MWEYKTLMIYDLLDHTMGVEDTDITNVFNQFGEEGWELVTVTGNNTHRAYFKRKKNV